LPIVHGEIGQIVDKNGTPAALARLILGAGGGLREKGESCGYSIATSCHDDNISSGSCVLCKPAIAYNTPMRALFSTVATILLVSALLMEAQAPQGAGKGGFKGKGGGFMPKNLQVLDRANFPAAMQSFVQALGLLDQGGCNYCHVEDRASDEKMQKVIARNMIIMVRDINARFTNGAQHVTCYTCHRGSTTPATAP